LGVVLIVTHKKSSTRKKKELIKWE
jgi:hypothetical protein